VAAAGLRSPRKKKIEIGSSRQKEEKNMTKPTKEASPAVSDSKAAEARPGREEIEVRAFQIYVERGGTPGQDVEDWLQAERELLEKHGKTTGKTKSAAV
jgi:hypothetical protein